MRATTGEISAIGPCARETCVRRRKGFSLIELLVVMAIIMLLAAIAVPNLLKSKLAANESSAVSTLRTINTAQVTYSVTYPAQGYADDLAKLGPPPSGTAPSSTASGLLDWIVGCGSQPCVKSGYSFAVTNVVGTPVVSFRATGVPAAPGQTGIRGFCSDQLGPIQADPAGGTNCIVPADR